MDEVSKNEAVVAGYRALSPLNLLGGPGLMATERMPRHIAKKSGQIHGKENSIHLHLPFGQLSLQHEDLKGAHSIFETSQWQLETESNGRNLSSRSLHV